MQRTHPPTFLIERRLSTEGYRAIAGLDEAGRGAWAGPIVAAAVILPKRTIQGLRDSKTLRPVQRQVLYEQICEVAIAWSVHEIPAADIDRHGITWANKAVLEGAFAALPHNGDYALVDGILSPKLPVPLQRIVRGDATVASIAAASILAKVTRDRIMDALDARYPMYGFSHHRGYGTAAHMRALNKHGPSPLHRFSFRPLRNRDILQSN
jgi:ribonuclease HII